MTGQRVSFALLMLCAALAASSPASARTRLSISAPKTALGDGITPIEIAITTAKDIDDLEVTASGGTLGAPEARGESTVVYLLVPPHVAGAVSIELKATARRGRRTLRVRRSVEVTAFVPPWSPRRTGGPLDLTGPDRLVLGAHRQAELSLAAESEPRLLVSAGTVSPPSRSADGRWRATYTPPATFAPSAAIVAAIAADGRLDWLVVPLYGKGRLRVTSEPSAHIELDVAGTRFGPLVANRRGGATFPITAPPGLTEATVVARDKVGNQSQSALPLKPPGFNRVLVACPVASAPARVLAIDARGRPLAGARFTGEVDVGQLGSFDEQQPGVYSVPIELRESLAASTETLAIRVQLAGQSNSESRCRGEIPGQPPVDIELSVSQPSARAGGQPVAVNVRLVYRPGARPLPWPIDLTADQGQLGEPERRGERGLTASWTPPRQLNAATARISASLRDVEARATAEISLEPGPPAALRVRPPPTVRADGRSSSVAVVSVVDEYDNPSRATGLELRVGDASFPLQRSDDGQYRGTFTVARKTGASGVIAGQVRSGDGLSAAVSIPFRGVRPRLALAVRGGYSSNLGKVAGPTGAITADWHLPVAGGERLAVGVDAGALTSSDDGVVAATTAEEVDVGILALPVLARLSLWQRAGPLWLYGGATGGAAPTRTLLESPSIGTQSAWELTPAVGGFAGTDVPLGPARVLLEVAYLLARVDSDSVQGNVLGLSATLGLRFGFF